MSTEELLTQNLAKILFLRNIKEENVNQIPVKMRNIQSALHLIWFMATNLMSLQMTH